MTLRQVYDALLIETNKVEAPSLLLEDFIYFVNKAIHNKIEQLYPLYDVNQQVSDDLRVLKKGFPLLSSTVPSPFTSFTNMGVLNGITLQLPRDYMHMLSCSIQFTTINKVCGEYKNIVRGAQRMQTESVSGVIDNFYTKPSIRKPYFYPNYKNEPTIDINQPGSTDDTPLAGSRLGNTSNVVLEIIYGNDTSKYAVTQTYIEYLRTPQYVTLTHNQLDSVEDTSQILEFPNYVCLSIIKELCKLVLENTSDPRLQTNIPINQMAQQMPQQQTQQG